MKGLLVMGMEMPRKGEFSRINIYDNGEVTIGYGDERTVYAVAEVEMTEEEFNRVYVKRA